MQITLLLVIALAVGMPSAQADGRFSYRFLDTMLSDNDLDGMVVALDGPDRLAVEVDAEAGIELSMSFAVSPALHVFGGYSRSSLDLDLDETVRFPTIEEIRASFAARPGDPNFNPRADLDNDDRVNFRDVSVLARALRAGTEFRSRTQLGLGGTLEGWRLGLGLNRTLAPNWGAYARVFADFRRLDHRDAMLFAGRRAFGGRDHGVGAAAGLRIKATDLLELEATLVYSPVGAINVLGRTNTERFDSQTLAGFGGRCILSKRLSLSAGFQGDGDVRLWQLGFRLSFGPGNPFRPVYRSFGRQPGIPCL